MIDIIKPEGHDVTYLDRINSIRDLQELINRLFLSTYNCITEADGLIMQNTVKLNRPTTPTIEAAPYITYALGCIGKKHVLELVMTFLLELDKICNNKTVYIRRYIQIEHDIDVSPEAYKITCRLAAL